MSEQERNFWQEDDLARDVRAYLSALSRPLGWSLVLILILYIISTLSFLEWTLDWLNNFTWLVKVGALLWAVWRIKDWSRGQIGHGALVGVLLGAILGLASALFKVLWFFNYWLLINLAVEPILTAAIGGLVGLVFLKILKIKNNITVERSTSVDKTTDKK